MASEGWADAVPGQTRSRLAPASAWTDFVAVCAALPRTAGLGPTQPSEAMTMRFYSGQHRFYCGVDLHTRTLSLCGLDSSGAIALEATLPPEPVRTRASSPSVCRRPRPQHAWIEPPARPAT